MIVEQMTNNTEIAFSLNGDPDYVEENDRKSLNLNFLQSHAKELETILEKIEQSPLDKNFHLVYSFFGGNKNIKKGFPIVFSPKGTFIITQEVTG